MLTVGLSFTGSMSSLWSGSKSHGRTYMVLPSCLHRDSEEDTELSCARGSCLASRVASCSCELLMDGRLGT